MKSLITTTATVGALLAGALGLTGAAGALPSVPTAGEPIPAVQSAPSSGLANLPLTLCKGSPLRGFPVLNPAGARGIDCLL